MKRALVALVVLVAACSSSKAAPRPSSTTTTSTTAAPSTTTAAPRPDPAAVKLQLTKVATFDQPLDLKWCDRPLVAEKTGKVKELDTGKVVLDVSADVSSSGEQGLLGIACSPDNKSLWFDYTSRDGTQDRLDVVSWPDGGNRRNVLAIPDPAPNHNGGNLVFGPDGKLWYGTGDGGGGNDQFGNARNPKSLLAKILRIDPATGAATPVVFGVRNPWRWSFDRANGDLWIGDVGQGEIEEIDHLPAGRIEGADLGWSLYEGTKRFRDGADPPNLVMPVYEYKHDRGLAVLGGYVYRGNAIPALRGAYVYTDSYKGDLRAYVLGDKTDTELNVNVPPVVGSFAQDPNGELYVLSLAGGVYRIGPAAPETPRSAEQAGAMFNFAEAAIHAGDTTAGQLEQVAVRAFADNPGWVDAGVVVPQWRAALADDVAAGQALRKLVGAPKPNLPPWRIVDPAPADELLGYYREAERATGVPWQYLAAVHLVETKMGRIRGTSTAGAEGPMQFLPSTWKQYGQGDINSNRDAILTAARYLKAAGAPARMNDALFAYNRSDLYVTGVSRYAERMKSDPAAYRGYWGWQVYYWSTSGDVWLPPGWRGA